jgi:MraZ protein
MLLGEHEHTIDEKNRLTLPAKFRRAFVDGVVLKRGVDGCIDAYPRAAWDRFVGERLAGLDPFSKEARQMNRFVYAGAAEAELDRQGRVMIPAQLIEHASLGRGVVVAGVGEHLEIWDRDAWRAELTDVGGGVEAAAERLAERA